MLKKFIILCVLFVLLEAWVISPHAATFNDAKRVFNRLQTITNYHVVLKYSKSLRSNAWATPNSITINQGILDDVQNDSQLAMILGHELSHYILRHPRYKASSLNEISADKEGYKLCKRAGYRKCLGWMTHAHKLYDWIPPDGVHPSYTKRLEYIRGTR